MPSQRTELKRLQIAKILELEASGQLTGPNKGKLAELRKKGLVAKKFKGVAPGPLESFGAGLTNLGSGIKQIRLGLSDKEEDKKKLAKFNRETIENRALFEKGQASRPLGPGRFISQTAQLAGEFGPGVAAGLGAGAVIPAAAGTGALTSGAVSRFAIPAVAGGIGSGIQFIEPDQPGGRALQTGLGTLAGPLGPPIARGGGAVAKSLGRQVNKIPGVGRITEGTGKRVQEFLADPTIAGRQIPGGRREVFERNVIAVQNILDKTHDGKADPREIATIIQRQISRDGTVDAKAIAREIQLTRANQIPTLGSVTRDPDQLVREIDLAQDHGGNIALGRSAAANERSMRRNLGEIIAPVETGATRQFAGGTMRSAAKQVDDRLKKETDVLFNTARATDGYETPINSQVTETLARDLESILNRGKGILPIKMVKEVRELIKDGGSVTPRQASALMNLVKDARSKRITPDRGRRLGQIRDALRKSLVSDGGPASKATLKAWDKAAVRRDTIAAADMMNDVLTKKFKPGKFVQKHYINGDVEDIRALERLADTLPAAEGEAIRNAMRQAKSVVADQVRKAADPSGEGFFNVGRLRGYVDRLGPEKVEAILGKEAGDQIDQILAVHQFARPGPAARVPRQLGGQDPIEAGLNVAQRSQVFPGVGIMARGAQVAQRQSQQALSNRAKRGQVSRALALRPDVRERTIAAQAGGGAAAPGILQGGGQAISAGAGGVKDFLDAQDTREKIGLLLGG